MWIINRIKWKDKVQCKKCLTIVGVSYKDYPTFNTEYSGSVEKLYVYYTCPVCRDFFRFYPNLEQKSKRRNKKCQKEDINTATNQKDKSEN